MKDHPRGYPDFVHSGRPAYERPKPNLWLDFLDFYLPFLLFVAVAAGGFYLYLNKVL